MKKRIPMDTLKDLLADALKEEQKLVANLARIRNSIEEYRKGIAGHNAVAAELKKKLEMKNPKALSSKARYQLFLLLLEEWGYYRSTYKDRRKGNSVSLKIGFDGSLPKSKAKIAATLADKVTKTPTPDYLYWGPRKHTGKTPMTTRYHFIGVLPDKDMKRSEAQKRWAKKEERAINKHNAGLF